MVANYLHLDNMVQIHVRMYIRVFFNVEQKLEKIILLKDRISHHHLLQKPTVAEQFRP